MKISKESFQKHQVRIGFGDIIFKEHETGDEMYIIIEGEVEIYRQLRNAQKVLMELKQGDIFGEMSLVDKQKRSACARAKTDCLLLAINQEQLSGFIEKNADFAVKLVRILSQRLRAANNTISDLLLKDRINIVLSSIIRFSQSNGVDSYRGKKINMDQYIEWAKTHIGLGPNDIRETIKNLIKNGKINRPSGSESEIIVPPEIDRRKR